jgi:hypothetical protein
MKAVLPIAVVLLTALAGQSQSTPPTHMPEEVAVFAIHRDGSSLSIDPVVIVHYGADQRFKTIPSLNPPIPHDWTDADFHRLENTFYKPGSRVSVFSGGDRLGEATVLGSNIQGSDGGCVDLSAAISPYPSTPLSLLAASTATEIPGHRSKRRPATAPEIAIIMQLARQWLADYGLDKQLLQRGAMGPVISTELRKGGGRAIIGRFDVTSKRAIHRLFAIAERDSTGYRLTLADLEIQHDLEDGKDTTEHAYVDQLDIDNDGLDEVVSAASYYESWNYTIWQFDVKHNVWRRSYTGGGGGC